jgi:uncharacterized protein (DUF927 family)
MTYKTPKAARSLGYRARHLLIFHDVHHDVHDVQKLPI